MTQKRSKIAGGAAAVAACGWLLCGCALFGPPDEPIPEFKGENHIAVNDDLSVSATLVETFAEPYYKAGELLAMLGEEASAFNAEAGPGSMMADGVAAEEGMVNARFRFAGPGAYARYNGAVFFAGTIDEAVNEGLLQGQILYNISDREKTIDREGLQALKNTYIIATNEHNRIGPLTMSVFGKVLYVSGGVERWYDSRSVRVALPSEGLVYVVFKP
jgi:hypothetical protein